MSPKQFTPEEIQRIYQVKSYILNNLHKKFTVAQLARLAAMNVSLFREGFQMVFDYRIPDYIYEARMQLGLFLLVHSDKTIKEIASLTGYVHTKSFMNAFKSFFGKTANSVRKT